MSVDYRDIPALNQSSLKKILSHPQDYLNAIKRNEESKEDYFIFGTLVDLMLTGTKEEFDNKFYVIKQDISVTDAVKSIVDGIVEEVRNLGVDLSLWTSERDIILKHVKYQNYQGNWKDDTRIDAIIKAAQGYVTLLETVGNRTIVTDIMYSKAVNAVAALRSDKFTQEFCMPVKKYPEHIQVIDKFIVSFSHLDFNIKGELDRVIINHQTQRIKPLDFKTTSKPLMNFMSEFWKLRYDFQAATYSLGLVSHPEIKELLEKGYTMEPFRFIVAHSESITAPMVFTVPMKVITIGTHGGETSVRYYEGLEQALQRYEFATTNNLWDYPKEYYEKGSIDIEL
jgi:hypothetical protein